MTLFRYQFPFKNLLSILLLFFLYISKYFSQCGTGWPVCGPGNQSKWYTHFRLGSVLGSALLSSAWLGMFARGGEGWKIWCIWQIDSVRRWFFTAGEMAVCGLRTICLSPGQKWR